MRKQFQLFLMIMIIAGYADKLPAQNSASATWALSSVTTTSSVSSGGVTAADELFRGTEVNGYTGANNSQRVRMKTTPSNTWPTNLTSQIDTVYVQFAVSPAQGLTFDVTSISLSIGAASTNTMKANIWYSKDPNFNAPTSVAYNTGNNNNYLTSGGLTQVSNIPNVKVAEGETFYLRIYPWYESATVGSGKYACIQNIVISGTTSGSAVISLATLTTVPATKISTTSAVSGGNISADGGGAITARGICWNTTGSPTISDNKTNDSSGVGSFVSTLTNLSLNTKYYIRAYATNSAGTAYGNHDSLTTLAALTVPTVLTSAVSSILVTSAVSGGNVLTWGGSEVTAKGVCWNTTGTPTIADNKTIDGTDIGLYSSALRGLTEATKYYLRAYATNAQGTGYGVEINFTTQSPAPDVTKIVALDGSGDYTKVQDAFNAVPDNYTGVWRIFVKKGTYKEKLLLAKNKINVVLQGEERDSTILTYDDYAGKAGLGTSGSYSVSIDANDFMAKDITFQNTVKNDGSFPDQQGVALRANGDKQIYFNCKMLGYQDTYYTYGIGRIYNKDCYIEGSVDFIFGKSTAVFDHCTINCNRNNSVLTAASTDASLKFGYVFLNCTITTNANGFDGTPITLIYLGRPWQNKPQTVYINCYEPANLSPLGWTTMQVNPLLYAEYNCTGPGFKPSQRNGQWGNAVKQLSDSEAAEYTIANIFAKSSGVGAEDWTPPVMTSVEEHSSSQNIPAEYLLLQNHPNPFNPSTRIVYSLPEAAKVKLEVFDLLGKRITTLVDGKKESGRYSVTFNASNLSSGIYIYRLATDRQTFAKKMLLMK